MAGVLLLLDLVHPRCSRYSGCMEQRVRQVQHILRTAPGSEPVFVLTEQRDAGEEAGAGTAALLQQFSGLNARVRLIAGSSTAAALYAFKRACDALDGSRVQVQTCSARSVELQLGQELLFTQVYSFHYSMALEGTDCPLLQLPSTRTSRLTELKENISNFLQQLPAESGEITLLKSPLISGCFSHGFTTRTGGISYIDTLRSLNLFSSSRRRDSRATVAENLRRLSLHAGFQTHQFYLTKVNHANDVWVMNKPEPESYDAIVTNQPNVVIAAPGADCMPLLFTDPVKKVIGVAHAGWKGTLMGVAMATVNAMVREFGSELANVVALIGPSVGPCCFTLEQISANKFHAIHPNCVRDIKSQMPYVDIRLATRVLLEKGGLLSDHIQDHTVQDRPNITLCTSCHPELFFSHVRDGVNFGTQIGFLWIKDLNS